MNKKNVLTVEDLKSFRIPVYEPFADFLLGEKEEKDFEISLLDVVRFAGHACPSMVGAFLIAQRAVRELYPETGRCVRGEVKVDIPGLSTDGPIGPMANVFGYILGAWADSGFGGLGGRQFRRRDLLVFGSPQAPAGGFRFTHLGRGQSVDVFYNPQQVSDNVDPEAPFQLQWRQRIKTILREPERVLRSEIRQVETRV